MAETTPPTPPYRNTESAPFVYFDVVATHGVLNGAIEIDVASRVLSPSIGTSVIVEFFSTGRLRCSPTAARLLRDSINQALEMLNQPQEQAGAPTIGAAGKLN